MDAVRKDEAQQESSRILVRFLRREMKDIEVSVLRARLLDRPISKSIRDKQVNHCLAALCL